MPDRPALLLFRLSVPANTASHQNTSLCKEERMGLSPVLTMLGPSPKNIHYGGYLSRLLIYKEFIGFFDCHFCYSQYAVPVITRAAATMP